MIFWFLLALMLVIAILCILLPLRRANESRESESPHFNLLRAQIKALDDQIEGGGSNTETLRAERAEIARRLLAEARNSDQLQSSSSSTTTVKIVSLLALIVLPALSLSIYLPLGSPGLAGSPFNEQNVGKLEDKSVNEMVLLAERHLAKNPDDLRGWKLLANVYGRLGRAPARAHALEQIIRLSGASPELKSELAEAITFANENIVIARARMLFEEALAANPDLIKPQMYLAVALEQEGKIKQSFERWKGLARLQPGNEDWQRMTGTHIARLSTKLAPGDENQLANPSAEQIAAAQNLSPNDRSSMISAMVENLASKLEDEPDNLPGWLRLIRSYSVLGEARKAQAAYQSALVHFDTDEVKRRALQELAEQLKLSNTQTGSQE